MREAHAVEQVRVAERALMAKVPDGALMQRAAAGLAAICTRLLGRVYGARVVVLAGTGDNGGDALYAAARLARRGASVVAVAVGERLHEGGALALRQAGGLITYPGSSVADDLIADADLIIDGILGIGGHGGLREPAATLAGYVADASADGAIVVATDLPSGVDADTGVVEGAAILADVTVTFGTIKPGLLIDPGASYAGTVELVDIGLDPYLAEVPPVLALQSADIAALLPHPVAESNKYRRGVLGVIAGSEKYTGAAVLSVGGAIRAGAGMVRFISASEAVSAVRAHWPEAVLTLVDPADPGSAVSAAGRAQAFVAGPGLGTGSEAAALLRAALSSDLPVLVDADGLTVLAAHPELLSVRPAGAPTVITPHAGELARLTSGDPDVIEAHRLESVRRAAADLGVTVLLKGSTTLIATPERDSTVLVNPTGTPWLATAGSGDVLSGIAGALLAQGVSPAQYAAAAGAFLHGLAARLAAREAPIGAADLLTTLPDAIRLVHKP
ncbi:MAG TPA: NAD(P)H-hydrate dehydratase [Streptosporangiaceae bacterium]|nr:NAD(P)H-hydrate dehydratase [Streptosporangiaceae bacterium]